MAVPLHHSVWKKFSIDSLRDLSYLKIQDGSIRLFGFIKI